MSQKSPHSKEYIGEHRYKWWNRDYLRLLLERINFHSHETIADLGTGAGHWASLLLSEASQSISMTCVDFETHWLNEVLKNLETYSNRHSIKTVQSDAHNLKLESNQFDLTTCQTLLMHCEDPKLAVSEMFRVTRPGGYILIIEPTNILNRMQFFDAIRTLSPSDQSMLYYIWACYHKGLFKNKKGDHDIAAHMVGIIEDVGGVNIHCYQNDQVSLGR